MNWMHCVIDLPDTVYAETSRFWERALGWPAGDPWQGHPELRSFEPPDGTAYVHLQRSDGEPRVHLDVDVRDLAAETDRVMALGATPTGPPEAHGTWQALTSPGGLPFCLVAATDRTLPAAVDFGTCRSRLVQLCIDCPAGALEAEVEFWRAVLGGRWVPSSSQELAGKLHDDAGSPLQLLFQRLDEPAGPVRVHLDLGTDDLVADAARLESLGAERVRPGRGWITLRDPAGVDFCTTGNDPRPLRHRDIG